MGKAGGIIGILGGVLGVGLSAFVMGLLSAIGFWESRERNPGVKTDAKSKKAA